MRILLDTHVFLWAIVDDPRLSAAHRALYVDEANDLYLSVASVWEILIKCGIGKLTLPAPVTEYIGRQLEKSRIGTLAIHLSHLSELERLPPIHRDPFDRMLVAQARAEGMAILSADPGIRNYGAAVL